MKHWLKIILAGTLLSWNGALLWSAESLESSPWVGWRKGDEAYNRAGAFKESNQYDRALEAVTQAREYFLTVKRIFPDWNSRVINGRIQLCDGELAELRSLSGRLPVPQEEPEPSGVVARAGNERPSRPSGKTERPLDSGRWQDDVRSSDTFSEGNVGESRLYLEMQTELDQYKIRLRKALTEIDDLNSKLRQNSSRTSDVESLLREYRTLQEDYALLNNRYKQLQERGAGGTSGDGKRLQSQLLEQRIYTQDLEERIHQLESENEKNTKEYAARSRELLALKQQLSEQKDLNARTQRELDRQKSMSAQFSTLQTELSEWRVRVDTLETQLTQRSKRIEDLMKLLEEAHTSGGDAGAENGNSAINVKLARENQQLQEELDQLKLLQTQSDSTQLQDRIRALTLAQSALRDNLAAELARRETLETELAALQKSGERERSAMEVATLELEGLREQNQTLEQEVKSWSGKYNELKRRFDDRLTADAADSGSLSEEKELIRKRLEELQTQHEELTVAHEKLKQESHSNESLLKSAKQELIDLKAAALSSEIELKKMAVLQKSYDDLSRELEALRTMAGGNNGTPDEVLNSLRRIPGLEESIRRYEKENAELLKNLAAAQQALQAQESGEGTSPRKADDAAAAAQAATLPEMAAVTTLAPEKIADLFADAELAEQQEAYEVAVFDYRQILARDTQNVPANRKLGKIYLLRERFAEAGDCLSIAVKADQTGDVDLFHDYLSGLIGVRKYADALEQLQAFQQRFPQTAAAEALMLDKAVCFSRSGRQQEAEAALKAVLATNPGNAAAAYELALLLSGDETRLAEAGDYYLKARDNGIDVDLYLEDILKSVMKSDRGTLDFLRQTAADALRNGDVDTAKWYFAELKNLAPDDPENLKLFFATALLEGDLQEVRRLLEGMKTLQDSDGIYLRLLAALATGEGGELEALATIAPAVPAEAAATREKYAMLDAVALKCQQKLAPLSESGSAAEKQALALLTGYGVMPQSAETPQPQP